MSSEHPEPPAHGSGATPALGADLSDPPGHGYPPPDAPDSGNSAGLAEPDRRDRVGDEQQPGVVREPAPASDEPERMSGRRRSVLPVWAELPVLVVVALGLAVLVKAFLVQAFFIPSGSMEDTLRIGDRVLVDKVSYRLHDISRGDVVVFNGVDSFTSETEFPETGNVVQRAVRQVGSWVGVAPPDERDFIKRVIGVPGDHVASDGAGKVTVNGVPLREKSYLFPGDSPSDTPFDVVVPPGKLWVMGDHRSESADSREHMGEAGGGFVPEDKVIGKAFVIVWPFDHWRTLGTPTTYEQPSLTAQH